MNIVLFQTINRNGRLNGDLFTLCMRVGSLMEKSTASQHKSECIVAIVMKHAVKVNVKWVDGMMIIAEIPDAMVEAIMHLFDIAKMTSDVKHHILNNIDSVDSIRDAIDSGMMALAMKPLWGTFKSLL